MAGRLAAAMATLVLILAGCGEPESEAPVKAPEEVVRARLESLWAAVATGEPAALAPFLAYAGPDKERRYKEPAQFEGEQVAAIERIHKRIAGHLAGGKPTFERFESRKKRDQTWLAWHVAFGEGDAAKKAIYAFVEAKGTWLLGDID